jgi:hypothetical protein
MARSIALLGARGDEVRLDRGRTARLWAEAVTAKLLTRANEDESARLWMSLEDVMPLLAEAAPDVFLRAIAQGVEGPDPLLGRLFRDNERLLAVSSPHTGLLWALETAAWSPLYLGFASELLAILTEIDPGGRLSNRPAATLVDIFRPQRPQTSASAETRLLTLDALLDHHFEVAWDLLVALLPRDPDFAADTHKPEFRDWASGSPMTVTRQDCASFVEAVGDRLIAIVSNAPDRWVSVVAAFDRLPPRTRTASLKALKGLDIFQLSADVRTALWSAIESLVRRHREYSDAEWSITDDVLTSLESVGQRLQPPEPSTIYRWLFDDWHPILGVSKIDDPERYDRELASMRLTAVRDVLDREGISALADLAAEVKVPAAVGASLATVSDQDADAGMVQLLESSSAKLRQFALTYARVRAAADATWVTEWIDRSNGRPEIQSRLLQAVGDLTVAWRTADAIGGEVPKVYWSEFLPYGRGDDLEVAEAARRLVKYGRAAVAVEVLSIYSERLRDEIDVDVVVTALKALDSAPEIEAAHISESDLTRLLDFLRARNVTEEDIAAFEWKFLSVLGREGHTPSLKRLLARDPAFFTTLVSTVFRPAKAEGEPEEQASETAPEQASNAYRLLREWQIVPGTDDGGVVNPAALQRWLSEARRLLRKVDRADIGEFQIGEVLAYSPVDQDGAFPALAVRDALERAPNDRLGRGFVTGLCNKRGVTRRGMTEGGQQEYHLAGQYDDWAARIEVRHPRTAAILRSVAEIYREEGRRNDEEVKRLLERLGPSA